MNEKVANWQRVKWVRVRFRAHATDPRPLVFPPPGPYWVTGYGSSYSTIVAYLPIHEWMITVERLWPEAEDIKLCGYYERIEFDARFQCPEWWSDKTCH